MPVSAGSGASPARRTLILLAALLLWAVFVLGIAALAGRTLEYEETLLAIFAGLCLLPLANAVIDRDGDLLSPISFIGAVTLMLFVVRAAFLRYGNVRPEDVPTNLVGDYQRFLASAIELSLVAWMAALVGYYLPIGKVLAGVMPPITMLKDEPVPWRILVVWGVGILFKALQVLRGTSLAFQSKEGVDNATSSYIDYLSTFSDAAVCLYAIQYFRGRLARQYVVFLWCVAVPFELLYGLVTGGKLRVLMPIIAVLLAYNYCRRRVRFAHLLAVAAVTVFVVFPVVVQYRALYVDRVGYGDLDMAVGAQVVSDAAVNLNEQDDFVTEALRAATNRLHGTDSIMLAVKMTPEFLPWADPTLFGLWPVMALVPRLLWRDKPVMVLIPNWEVDYWGLERGAPSSMARTHLGGLYLTFGWWGAVLGMGLVGLFWRFLHQAVALNWGPCAILLQYKILNLVIRIENDIPQIYAQLMQVLIVFFILVWFVRTPNLVRRRVLRPRPA
jgi:hypothetical protein